jgi:hypothetical protein
MTARQRAVAFRRGEEVGLARRHQVGVRARRAGAIRVARLLLAGALACLACGAIAEGAFAATVARWHMDETSGTVMRDAVRSHNGSFANHLVQLGQPGFSGFAYGFNGSTSYVSVPSASDLNPVSANLTITIRLKTTLLPPPEDWDLIRKGVYSTPGGEWKVEYYPSGQAACAFKGSSKYSELIAGPKLNNGQWHTVRCVKASSAIKLIVDGQTFSKSVTTGSIANSVPVVIGAYPGSEYFKGALDEVSISVG